MKLKTTKDYIVEGVTIKAGTTLLYEDNLEEMAIPCSPKKNGGKYPMWIKIPYSKDEHPPAHAHLYATDSTFITKFKITDKAPVRNSDIQVMPKCEKVPSKYCELLIEWAKDSQNGINNWERLKSDWQDFIDAYEAGLFD